MALDSATCALAASKNVKPVVVIVDIPEEWVEPDTSCDNMDYAEMCLTDVPYSYIKAILIGPDLGLFRGFFISSMLGREWSAHEFSDIEIRVAEALKEVWIDPEDIVNPEDLEEISLR